MRRDTLSSLMCALGVAYAVALHAQTTPTTSVLATRSGVSLNGRVQELGIVSPNGRFIVEPERDSLWIYDVRSHARQLLVASGGWDIAWSARSDAVAFVRQVADGNTWHVWSVRVDPESGKPRSAPQRVSTTVGLQPAFSHDGKFIAFAAQDSLTYRLMIVPSTGGREREIYRNTEFVSAMHWSPDDRTIFFQIRSSSPPTSVQIFRIAAAGGPARTIFRGRYLLRGLTGNGAHLVLSETGEAPHAAQTFALVIDTAGRQRGRVELPKDGQQSVLGVVGDSAIALATVVQRSALRTLTLSTGVARTLPITEQNPTEPEWSPDGKFILFLNERPSGNALMVTNADGVAARAITEVQPRSLYAPFAGWSPDGRTLVLQNQERTGLWLVDPAAGASTKVFEDSAFRAGRLHWNTDGTSIYYTSGLGEPNPVLYETTRSGVRRKVRAITRGFDFYDGASAFEFPHKSDSLRLAPLSGGAARALHAPPANEAGYMVGPIASSPRHDLSVTMLRDTKNGFDNALGVYTVSTGARRVINLPFTIAFNSGALILTPGGRAALVVGSSATLPALTLYRVPLDGSAISTVAAVPGYHPGPSGGCNCAISGDGTHFVYSSRTTGPTITYRLVKPGPFAAINSRIPR